MMHLMPNGTIDPLVAKTMTKTVMMPFQVRNAINNQHSTKSIAKAMLKIASAAAISIGIRAWSFHTICRGGNYLNHIPTIKR